MIPRELPELEWNPAELDPLAVALVHVHHPRKQSDPNKNLWLELEATMSAQIIKFPSTARAAGEHLRMVREGISERARQTNATDDQKFKALQVALQMMTEGKSAGYALSEAYKQLPSLRLPAFRQAPQPPEAA